MGNDTSSPIAALCLLSSERVNGSVYFYQKSFSSKVRVEFRLTGEPGKKHAIHIHEFGDMRKGCDSLGAHYNPENTTHGSLEVVGMERHAGDLINNIKFNDQGKFEFDYEDDMLNLYPYAENILGRSVVIHEKEDDLGLGKGDLKEESLKTGNAGKRICCGIIGLCKV